MMKRLGLENGFGGMGDGFVRDGCCKSSRKVYRYNSVSTDRAHECTKYTSGAGAAKVLRTCYTWRLWLVTKNWGNSYDGSN